MELLREGYANPSWSPDGRWIAAERTSGTGRDIVILDPESGAEVARLTNDGDSFAPTFSPNGNQIAFLRRKGLGVAELPAVNQPVLGDGLAYHLRTGPHDITPYDWARYLDHADKVLKR